MVADLAVQRAQRLEHVVVEVLAEHEGQHRPAQRAGASGRDAAGRRDHPALEPGKALPFASLDQEVLLQRTQRDRRRPRIAVGAQRQIDPEHLAVLGDVAHRVVDVLDRLGEVFVVGDAVSPGGVARRLPVLVVDVDQVDVAGDVEFAGAKLAHADDPEFGAAGRCIGAGFGHGRAVQVVQLGKGQRAGLVQRNFGQLRHGPGDVGQWCLLLAVQHHQAFHHQLAQHPQGRRHGQAALAQRLQRLRHRLPHRGAGGQQCQFVRVPAADALHIAGMVGAGLFG